MGLLDRLRGRTRPVRDVRPLTGAEAVVAWRALLGAAPAEALVAAHEEGVAALGDAARAGIVHRLRRALLALDPGAVVPADPAALVRAGARAERRAPGFLERAICGEAGGQESLVALATAVVGSAAAAPFLEDTPGEPPSHAPEVDEGAAELPGGGHDDALDDED